MDIPPALLLLLLLLMFIPCLCFFLSLSQGSVKAVNSMECQGCVLPAMGSLGKVVPCEGHWTFLSYSVFQYTVL